MGDKGRALAVRGFRTALQRCYGLRMPHIQSVWQTRFSPNRVGWKGFSHAANAARDQVSLCAILPVPEGCRSQARTGDDQDIQNDPAQPVMAQPRHTEDYEVAWTDARAVIFGKYPLLKSSEQTKETWPPQSPAAHGLRDLL